MLAAFHGYRPTTFQLVATYGVAVSAAVVALVILGLTWQTALLAFLIVDWVGGVVANSAETVRAWWRDRPRLRTPFVVIHLLELPLVYWLSGGGIVFALLVLVLLAKLSVFLLGWEGRTS